MTVEAELAALRAEVRRLRAENTRLEAVLRLTPGSGPGRPGGNWLVHGWVYASAKATEFHE